MRWQDLYAQAADPAIFSVLKSAFFLGYDFFFSLPKSVFTETNVEIKDIRTSWYSVDFFFFFDPVIGLCGPFTVELRKLRLNNYFQLLSNVAFSWNSS